MDNGRNKRNKDKNNCQIHSQLCLKNWKKKIVYKQIKETCWSTLRRVELNFLRAVIILGKKLHKKVVLRYNFVRGLTFTRNDLH